MMRNKKRNQRKMGIRISVMICLTCVILTSVIMPVSADVSAEEKLSIIEESDTKEVVEAKTEVTELRTENSETFYKGDGIYECIIYSDDKYFRDSNGNLKEIDNSIVQEEYRELNGNYHYKNKSGHKKIYLSRNKPEIYMQYNKAKLSFACIDANKTTAKIGGIDKKIAGHDIYGENKMLYENVYNGTDFIYEICNDSLKEYIILKDASAPNKFSFEFKTYGNSVELSDDGRVIFYDNQGEIIYELEKMYAVDSAGVFTYDLEYNIENTKENKVVISVSISPEYVSSQERQFPIIIDPTITITGTNTIDDAYVCSKNPDSNYYLSEYLKTGRTSGDYIRRSYIKFEFPEYLWGKNVTSAKINIKKYSGKEPHVKAYMVTGNWNPSTVTWNNKPATSAAGTSEFTSIANKTNWYSTSVTSQIKYFANERYPYYGFMLKDETESGTTQYTAFYSSDAPSQNKPELVVTYTEYPANSVSVRKVTDFAYREEYSAYTTKINNYFTNIGLPFSAKWNITFTHHSWEHFSALPAVGCTLANNVGCCSKKEVCGDDCFNEDVTPNHHKNHYYNYYNLKKIGKGTADIMVGFFGFMPCGPNKSAAGGLASEWLATVCQPNIWDDDYNHRTMQHEISHLFGCPDGDCVPGQKCIMSGGFDNEEFNPNHKNIWCDKCIAKFNPAAH